MTRRDLFTTLCAIATALEQEAQRFPCTTTKCVLDGLVADLDRCIDDVVDAKEPQTWRWMEDE